MSNVERLSDHKALAQIDECRDLLARFATLLEQRGYGGEIIVEAMLETFMAGALAQRSPAELARWLRAVADTLDAPDLDCSGRA